jgi:hypothetical protein
MPGRSPYDRFHRRHLPISRAEELAPSMGEKLHSQRSGRWYAEDLSLIVFVGVSSRCTLMKQKRQIAFELGLLATAAMGTWALGLYVLSGS